MRTIETLVEDIYEVLKSGPAEGVDFDEAVHRFGSNLSRTISDRLTVRHEGGTLRMSNIGKPCTRALWYEVNQTEDKEELEPHTRMKFLFGDILEEVLLFLAEAAGHTVEGRQDTQEIEGIKGHRDAVIDGTVVDVKSASTYSFQKFKDGKLAENDAFGYIEQIQSYIHAGQDDEVVTDKDRGAFLVVDKTLGHLCLDVHQRRTQPPIELIYKYKKDVVSRDEPPSRAFDPIPEGKSGNMKLGVNCSYCNFQKTCWPEARTFLYANKPVTLVTVVREPNVPELTG